MPVVLRIKGFRFFFYSDEGFEPMHIHIEKAEKRGKIWLEPEYREDYLYGFTVGEVKDIRKIIDENIETLKSAWYEYFK